MFYSKAHAGLKNKELTDVNDCFQAQCNAASGHYGQTLYTAQVITKSSQCRSKRAQERAIIH